MRRPKIFQELNAAYFCAELPQPKLNWNPRMRTTAGRFSTAAVIEIASYLQSIENGSQHVRDTMLHEMIHYWLWFKKKPFGHSPEFYKKMHELGAKRYNTVPIVRPPKYHYQCPECETVVPARRKLGNVACLDCCRKYNRGYYQPKFKLAMMSSDPHEKPKKEFVEHPEIPEMLEPFHRVLEKIESIRDTIRNSNFIKRV